jgi:hypothetical protein
MNKQLSTFLSATILLVVLMFSGIGLHETVTGYLNPPTFVSVVNTPELSSPILETKTTESAEFITGSLAANVGELCVFKLNDSETRADWIIVPEAKCYIDSSGSSLVFASNVPAKYTIIAAIVDEGESTKKPKILTHVCDYGISPEPIPNPSPTPSPSPTPKPTPNPVTLSSWVTKNIPATGYSQAAALASCYESAAEAIDKGTIKTTAAAYSALRTATQTKINIDVWQPFLDELSVKITERLDGSSDIKKLGTVFSEIAVGLKTVSDTKISAELEVSADDIVEPFH